MNKVSYEWWVEEVDADDDIQECYEIDFKEWPVEPRENLTARLCVRRLMGNDVEGLLSMGYAYFQNGSLEEEFCCGHRVPKRFLIKAAAIQQTIKKGEGI